MDNDGRHVHPPPLRTKLNLGVLWVGLLVFVLRYPYARLIPTEDHDLWMDDGMIMIRRETHPSFWMVGWTPLMSNVYISITDPSPSHYSIYISISSQQNTSHYPPFQPSISTYPYHATTYRAKTHFPQNASQYSSSSSSDQTYKEN
ncbi:hypothetical protein VTJ04DRAFT_9247 [Mycothermus thermophilus]|uniref:uncharacterized protein n=1 Tax=Humicola insolens TaxID=85995 RepID=UPI003743FCFA